MGSTGNRTFVSQIMEKMVQKSTVSEPGIAMVEEMAGSAKRAEIASQVSTELTDFIQTTVEDVVMKKAVPLLVQAVNQTFSTFFQMVEGMNSKVDQPFSTSSPMVQEPLPIYEHNPSSRSTHFGAESSGSNTLALHFLSDLPCDGLFTMTSIEDHEGASLKVELRNGSGSRIEDGPASGALIRLYLLCGEFDKGTDKWTAQDFNDNVAQRRKNKGELLKGKCEIYMNNGVADFSKVALTDNSSSRTSGVFRFGARVLEGQALVRDAVSEAFKVKERRSRANVKHPPSLGDPTVCLKHIGQALCQKLAKTHHVHTVKDFVQLCNTDAEALRKILQFSRNKWSELVEFAKLCPLTDKGYYYYDMESCYILLLDCVFNIVGVFDGQSWQPYGNLDDLQKKLAHKMRLSAYKDRHRLPNFDVPCDPILLQEESLAAASILYTSSRQQGCAGEPGVSFDAVEKESMYLRSIPGLTANQTQDFGCENENVYASPYDSFLYGVGMCQPDQIGMHQMSNSQQEDPYSDNLPDETRLARKRLRIGLDGANPRAE